MSVITIKSPIDGRIVAERELASFEEVSKALDSAIVAQTTWNKTSIKERAAYCLKAIEYFLDNQEAIGKEISLQMGRPIRYAAGELNGLAERGRYMVSIAEKELADIAVEEKAGFTRFIRREPLGVVFTIAPWNYPYLTAVNSIVPALMAGNTVLLKHSSQTLLCAERFAEAFDYAGLPSGVFQYVHIDHDTTAKVVSDDRVDFVSFTGSVKGGEIIEKDMAGYFKGLALELGGKDPAYIREDANLAYAIENVLDGVFFNSGQSCCGIERIYVHESLFERFVEGAVTAIKEHKLGDSLDADTTLGPMISAKAADFVRGQVADAVNAGARKTVEPRLFPMDAPGTPYMAPQLLTHVNHTMSIMTEESFGPVVGVMSVADDEEAIKLMNDSPYGLTASIWTEDEQAALAIGDRLETGTVFMNRCDYLDPALAWVGVKKSGRGCALSSCGYTQLTRPKSFHLKTLA